MGSRERKGKGQGKKVEGKVKKEENGVTL